MFVGKGKNSTLFRAVKFEIKPETEALNALLVISGICRTVWNESLAEIQAVFDTHLKPIYDKLHSATVSEEEKKALQDAIKKAYTDHPMPTYIDQQNALTEKIPANPKLQSIVRSWIEQVLVELHGSYLSFVSLRKKGDRDAKVPRAKKEGFFCDVSGRSGFKVDLPGGFIVLSTQRLTDSKLKFGIPPYQLNLLRNALAIKDFTLFRDERDLTKPGRFWISVAYEIPKPETKELVPEEMVFIALGSTKLGVVSPSKQTEIPIGRPDMYWQPKIESVKARMKGCDKGSRKWERLNGARNRMEVLKSRQQKLNRREIVQKLMQCGTHFVVTDLVVRSKPGKLADKSKQERGGVLGLNWTAQNSGAFGGLVAQLVIKSSERGGTVRRHPMPLIEGGERLSKVQSANLLREDFLASCR